MNPAERLDRMRAKQGLTAPPTADKPKKPAKPSGEMVHPPQTQPLAYRCGHAARDIAAKSCDECRNKARQAKIEKGRLPHGATFHVRYDAEKHEWSGTLTIHGCPEFSDTASGLFKLNRKLDIAYRSWLAAQEKAS